MLNAENMISAAFQKTQLNDFGDGNLHDGLNILIEAVNQEGKFTETGEQRFENFVVNTLVNRLKVEEFIRAHPEAKQRPIDKPLFVFGLPRSGTTLAINLLHEDPGRRSLLRWEAGDSVPPPSSETLSTDPRCIREQMIVDASLQHAPHISAIHHENADSPTECQFIMSQNFCAQYYDAIAEIPSYRQWWLDADYLETFKYHKRLLQVLQWDAPGRWTLKNPWHALYLNELTSVYPDAQLVMTHRDPVTVISSFCSLIKNVRAMFSEQMDPVSIGRDVLDTFEEMIRRTINYREDKGWNCIYDLHYSELTNNPITEIKKIYAHFEETLTADAEQAMQTYLQDNPKGKHGKHVYSLEEYGLTKEIIEQRFTDYYQRFNVTKET